VPVLVCVEPQPTSAVAAKASITIAMTIFFLMAGPPIFSPVRLPAPVFSADRLSSNTTDRRPPSKPPYGVTRDEPAGVPAGSTYALRAMLVTIVSRRTGGLMQALWLEDGQLSMRDVAMPDAGGQGEALVRVRLSGICGTDLELVRGYYPYTGVLGHEFVGDVVESPDPEWLGARVVAEINDACGTCATCRAGRPTHCEARTVLGISGRDGAHAEYVRLPLANLHRVPDSVSDDAAVFTEPLAAAVEILQQVHIAPADRVLLVGAGRLGQLVAQVLAMTGSELNVVARHQHQRDLLRARGIATIAEADIEPRSHDVVVEATGSPNGLGVARAALRPRGTLVLKSTYAGEVTIDLSPFVVDEITIVGSRCGPFAPAIRLLERGDVDPTQLIAQRYALADGLEAMSRAAERGVMKVLLKP
jgi:threonine dehydrogenase-like Zn-dependent dehydrogenase